MFYFSNVNNGKPKTSCKDALVANLRDGIDLFLYLYVAVLVVTAGGCITLFGILLYRLWVSCCKPKKKKKQEIVTEKDKKKKK